MQDVMVFLQGHGVGASMALRIYRVFGAATIDQIRRNSLRVGAASARHRFSTGGPIANSIGISGDFPLRVQAGVSTCLESSSARAAATALCLWPP